MQSILRIFPFLRHRDIFMAGESYAGHYIPAIADYFTVLNAKPLPKGDRILRIVGLAIGNGWSVPRVQYNYGNYAYNIGIISSTAAVRLTRQYDRCKAQEDNNDFSGKGACNILGEIMAASGACPSQREVSADDDVDASNANPSNHSKAQCYGPIVNYYDTRLYYDADTDWPKGDNVSVYYLNRQSVKNAINSKQKLDYKECSAEAGNNLAILDGLGVQNEIVNLLERGIPITFYNGQYDLICNHMGNGNMLSGLEWSGSSAYRNADEYVWTVPQLAGDGKTVRQIPAGYTRSTVDKRLTYIIVIGASHMVPYDVPKASLDLIRRIIRNESFGDFRQDLTWTFREDEDAGAAVKQELADLFYRIFAFLFKGPYAFDYSMIIVCALFITVCTCFSRGVFGQRTIYAYTRIPGNSDSS